MRVKMTREEVRRRINKLFKPFIVRRPRGNCQVLFALTELDGLVDGILELVCRERGGQMTLEMTRDEKVAYCGNTGGRICRSHFYNGHNNLGIEQCDHLEHAWVEKRSIQLDVDSPAWTEVETLSCFLPQYNKNEKWVREAGLVVAAGGGDTAIAIGGD